MTTAIVQHNQELIDISMQELGNPDEIISLSIGLDRSLTDHLVPGSSVTIKIDPIDPLFKKFSRLLKKPINKPASGDAESDEKFEGLEVWLLEADFIIT